jgi:hypothetical protein
MSSKSLFAVAALAALGGAIALAQPEKKTVQPPTKAPTTHGAQPAGEPKLPPGVSAEDMAACMAAATPGEMHKYLAKSVGTWTGKNKMWMAPDTEPMTNDVTSTVTALMDGKYFRCEMKGEMPGMGPFTGEGIVGFDNVSQKFVGTWIDNWGTGIMTGTGELSSSGDTLNWKYNFNCPINKKPMVMRQIEKRTGDNAMTIEMFGPEPHTGKEYKMMEITLTRSAGKPASN